MVKGSPGDQLMLDSQGSRPDFWCSQRVKHKHLVGQDLDHGHRLKCKRLCSVVPPPSIASLNFLVSKLEGHTNVSGIEDSDKCEGSFTRIADIKNTT